MFVVQLNENKRFGGVKMKLVQYSKIYEKAILSYELSAEQTNYTGIPKECIELSAIDQERHSILLLNDAGECVTFFVLHEKQGVKDYSQNDRAILVRSFSTDFRHQGKGYAKKALQLLPSFLKEHFPSINEIVLAVNEGNIAAQNLYKACGFVDEGVRKIGPKGTLLIMSYYL